MYLNGGHIAAEISSLEPVPKIRDEVEFDQILEVRGLNELEKGFAALAHLQLVEEEVVLSEIGQLHRHRLRQIAADLETLERLPASGQHAADDHARSEPACTKGFGTP